VVVIDVFANRAAAWGYLAAALLVVASAVALGFEAILRVPTGPTAAAPFVTFGLGVAWLGLVVSRKVPRRRRTFGADFAHHAPRLVPAALARIGLDEGRASRVESGVWIGAVAILIAAGLARILGAH
jgi:hypothetical protein